MAMVSIVHGPSPGSAASRLAGPVPSRCPATGRARRRPARRPARRTTPAGPGAWPAARPRPRPAVLADVRWPCGRALASTAGDGNSWVRPPAGSVTGSPYAAASRPAWVRAAAVDTCWPSTARTANSAASTVRGTRRPGALATSGASTGSADSSVADRHRVGVQVEQPAAAADRGGQVAQVGQGQLAADVLGPGPQRHDRRARGAAAGSAGRRRRAIPPRRAPRSRPGGRTGCPGSSGSRNGSRSDSGLAASWPAAPPAPRRARRRSSVGGSANTSRTVSLNVRMLANPAANATSPMGSAVVSISSRAVCARWARASASGPAPSSASSCRSTCRTL